MIDRRSILASPLAVALAPAASAAASATASPTAVDAIYTALVAASDRAISYRNQNHMWQTADGRTHLMLNRGFLAPPTSALAMTSSSDNGLTWTEGPAVPDTDYSTTSDGVLTGDAMWCVYSTVAGGVKSVVLTYDPAARTWTRGSGQVVYGQSASQRWYTPALAIDSLGTRWCCGTVQDNATREVRLRMAYRRQGNSPWVDTGLTFGAPHVEPPDGGTRCAGRPLRITGGVGMLYTIRGQIWWASRTDGTSPTAAWRTTLVHETPDNGEMVRGKYGGHYSMVSDAAGNIHVVTVENGRGLYLRRRVSTGTWDAPRVIAGTPLAAFTQATMCGNTLMLIVSTVSDSAVFQSVDGGNTFTNTHLLTHADPPADGSVDYSSPRQESPARSNSPVPVLQQYTTGNLQRLMYFAVPALGA